MSATSAWCAGPWKHSPIPKQPERDRERDECRGRVEPGARRVDEQPGGGPEQRHQRQRPHAALALDQARERSCASTITPGVDREDQADLALADAAWSRANCGKRLMSE